jgi:uncharacterized protein
MTLDSQAQVFALLGNPATHGGQAVKRIDTHGAAVFLTRDYAYKVKRAVRFPYLDYSTLDLRKAACEAEIEINRPYAPDIYLGVVPITLEASGQLALDGRGTPREWAVKMRRFNESMTLDHLADQRRIDRPLAEALGRTVAAAHKDARPADPLSWISSLATTIDEHAAAFSEVPELFLPKDVEALTRGSHTSFENVKPLLIERGRLGLVRRVHGDLHLGNIALILGRPVLFDAIEFSTLIGSGDVLYDLAFLLMDLVERRLRPAASTVFNRYLTETHRIEDIDALATFPFFLSLRAAIRAKVTTTRYQQSDAEDRPFVAQAARGYFDWARRFLVPVAPTLIAIGGLSGSGKSVLAQDLAPDLAPQPGALVLRSDVERKILFGQSEDVPLPAEAYAPDVTARIYSTITDKARRAIAAGHSVILDAVYAKSNERTLAERSAAILGVRFKGLFLEATLDARLARVAARSADASDADASVARAQEVYNIGTLDWTHIDATGTPEETLAHARRAIGV